MKSLRPTHPWAKTNMTRTHGWAPRGERLVDKVPHGHWKTTTFLAALRYDCIAAPCLFDGPIIGERFLAYVEQVLRHQRSSVCAAPHDQASLPSVLKKLTNTTS